MIAPSGRPSRSVDQREALLDFADADPDPRIDVAGIQHRHLERQRVVRCVSRASARIEISARRAPDIAAGAELARNSGFTMPVVTVRSCNEAVLS